ncbi:LysM peptidoglycan-binding domain-containing protein [Streptacidiphilus fuscans]|uniref:LysM peptidoglycan-binding domain-containing protein n=1 Tax=Streptacidiphilus fuscans TaxID=2789292 RepID=A0A931B0T6_9ACTN|nr:LysM peptidoglycan-binding domain-containing protein [Streptacidiphilus fuscans]MBF9066597.1 LysM peptidoglycan-binding domain-containing protein [Streptacidiphilus fuscans]
MLRNVVRAFLACVTLLVLMIGLPVVLGFGTVTVVHDARPAGGLAGLLTSGDQGNLFLWVLVLVGWVAWLSLAISLLVEIPAQLRGRVPRRLPTLGWSQRLAGGLVGAILSLLPVAGTALAAAPAPQLAITAPHLPQAAGTAGAAVAANAAGGGSAGAKYASVSEPHGAGAAADATTGQGGRVSYTVRSTRPAESLWSIADQMLGSGERWREIAALNEGRVMDAEHRVFDAERPIQPGWVLLLPSDAKLPSGGDASATADHAPAQPVEVTVRPGDTLSGIAETTMGTASDWPKLFAANRGVAAPDGDRLTDPNLIEPGMRLTVPGASALGGGGSSSGTTTAPTPPPAPTPAPKPPVTTTPATPPVTETPTPTPTESATSAPSSAPTSAAPTASAPTTSAPAGTPEGVPHATASQSPEEFALASGTSVLGAVVLGAVALRRSRRRNGPPRQGQHRTPRGPRPTPPIDPESRSAAHLTPVPMPLPPALSGSPQQTAAAAPATAPAPAAVPRLGGQAGRDLDLLGRALRSMARNVAREGRRLPPLNVVRLTPAHTVELHLAAPAPPVAPFRAAHASTVWWCTADAPGLLGPEAAAVVPSPYPALVSLGETNDGATVLVDLEAIRLLHISGEPEDVSRVLRTLALELTFTPLADRVGVHVVGVAAELAAVADDRLVVHQDLEHAVAALQQRDAAVRSALVEAQAATPREARSRGIGGDEWAPEVVLCAGYPTGTTPEALGRLLDSRPRGSVAVVTAAPPSGTGPVARWTLPASGSGVVPGLEMDLTLQRLDDESYDRWLRLLGANVVDPAPAAPEPSWPEDAFADLFDAFDDMGDSGAFGASHDAPDTSETDDSARRSSVWSRRDVVPPPRVSDATPPDPRLEHRLDPIDPVDPVELPDRPDPLDKSTGGSSIFSVDAARSSRSSVTEPALPGAAVVLPDPPGSLVPATQGRLPNDPWILALLATPPTPASPAHPQLRLLGPVELVGAAGPVEPERRGVLTEAAARRSVGPAQGAYVSADAIGRLREWLGDGPDGHPVTLRCDWDDFQALSERGLRDSGPAADTALARALALVRGAPFADVAYTWAEPLRRRMAAAVVDVAHELTLRRLHAGDHRGGEAAAARGLSADPDAELLLRDLLCLHADAGATDGLRATVARLEAKALRTGQPLEPESAALLSELRSASFG